MASLNKEDEIKLNKIQKIYGSELGYHTLKFPNGTEIKGKYDMSKYIKKYKIPNDLTGKNGYFSLEFSRRGADVTAIDKHEGMWIEEINQLMNSKVKFQIKDLTTLDESFGKFDIVFCGNMLQHNTDLLANLQKIRNVTKEMAIITTQIFESPATDHKPFALFLGQLNPMGKSFGTYWKPNMNCFKALAKTAGFRVVEEISVHEVTRQYLEFEKEKFRKEGVEPKELSFLEGVIHCYP